MRYTKRNTVPVRYIAALDDCVPHPIKKRYLLCWQIPLFSTIIDIKFMFSCKMQIMLTA